MEQLELNKDVLIILFHMKYINLLLIGNQEFKTQLKVNLSHRRDKITSHMLDTLY